MSIFSEETRAKIRAFAREVRENDPKAPLWCVYLVYGSTFYVILPAFIVFIILVCIGILFG